ncbi:MAG TPA: hypothetical protein VF178_00800 [Gemmatimonadaceae bacterium]
MSNSPHPETEAILAVLDDDTETLNEILAGMLPEELVTLRRGAFRLSIWIDNEISRRQMAGTWLETPV